MQRILLSLLLFAFGLLIFPLQLTIAAIDQSVARVLNPTVWVEALWAFGTNYLVAAGGFYALWALEAYVVVDLAASIEDAPVFGSSVPALLLLYLPRVLRYRLLGALCEPFLGRPLERPVIVPEEIVEVDDSEERLRELESGALTSRAILRMANTALSKKRFRLVYRAVEHLWKHHQESPELVQALWVASQAQEMEGQLQAMKATLNKLVTHHPNHPMASEARLKLRRL